LVLLVCPDCLVPRDSRDLRVMPVQRDHRVPKVILVQPASLDWSW
jgi:hypothetical protein